MTEWKWRSYLCAELGKQKKELNGVLKKTILPFSWQSFTHGNQNDKTNAQFCKMCR